MTPMRALMIVPSSNFTPVHSLSPRKPTISVLVCTDAPKSRRICLPRTREPADHEWQLVTLAATLAARSDRRCVPRTQTSLSARAVPRAMLTSAIGEPIGRAHATPERRSSPRTPQARSAPFKDPWKRTRPDPADLSREWARIYTLIIKSTYKHIHCFIYIYLFLRIDPYIFICNFIYRSFQVYT